MLGGTCLHWGCIPTKAMLFNAEIWDFVAEAEAYGIDNLGTPQLNWPKVIERKNGIVLKHVKGLDFLMRKNKVTVVRGNGRLTGPAQDGVHTVAVEKTPEGVGEDAKVQARNIVIATGSDARMLPGLAPGDHILTNMEILGIPAVPKSMIIIGFRVRSASSSAPSSAASAPRSP